MRILFVNQEPFVSSTGAERSALNTAIGLSKIGNEVEFLHCGDANEQQVRETEGQLFRSHSVKLDPLHPEFSMKAASRTLKEWLKQQDLSKYDIIHSHNSAAHLAIRQANINIPTIATVRDYRWLCEGDAMCYTQCGDLACCDNFLSQTQCSYRLSNHSSAFLPVLAARTAYRMRIQNKLVSAMKNIDHIISISNFIRDILLSNTDISDSSVTTIYNSIKNDQYPEIDMDVGKEILFVGSLKPQKGIIEGIRAFDIVSKTEDECSLIIAGDGWLRNQAEEEVKKLGLSEKVEFKGHVEREKIIELYQRASVVVYPSIWPEPFGRISIEAMASKTPIVGSQNGAIPEVLDNWPASQIIDPKDEKSFGKAIFTQMNTQYSSSDLKIKKEYSHIYSSTRHQQLYDQILR